MGSAWLQDSQARAGTLPGTPPVASIITPSLNQCAYLQDALESVRLQRGGGSVEHIVVDGGSTDGTVDLLRSSSATWVSEPDEGQSDALNKGFALARGQVIGWLNADEFYLPGALQAAAEVFARHPEVDVVYGDCLFADADGRLTRLKAEHAYCRALLAYYGCYIPTAATFFRRRLLDAGRLWVSAEYHYLMDWDLFLRLARDGTRMMRIPRPLAVFRWTAENKSLDADARWRERNAIQDSFGVVPRNRSARKVCYAGARGFHLLWKALNGALIEQVRWSRRRGESLKWWIEDGSE